jgi:hypothetical protein
MEKSIRTQVSTAFQSGPDLDGTIHGVRKIQQGKHGSRSSLFYSAKNEAFIPVESRLERLYCYTLEKNSEVLKYRSQAIAVPCANYFLYPDFLLLLQNEDVAVREIKAHAFANTEKNMVKRKFLERTLHETGIDFRVVTDKDLVAGNEQKNLMMTYDRGGRLPITYLLKETIKKICAQIDEAIHLKLARTHFVSQGLPPQYVEAAIFHGILGCDFKLPINCDTMVWRQS